MPPEEKEIQNKKQNQGQGFFGGMSITYKIAIILIAVSIFFLIWNFVFGGINSFYQLVFFLVSFVAIVGLLYFVFYAIQIYLAPDQFSPKKDYFNRLVNLAVDWKPDNVRNLYFRGDKDKKRVMGGTIVGLLRIPYLIGELEKYETDLKNSKGEKIADKGSPKYEYSRALQRKVPVFKKIEYGNDGDTLFVYESGWFLFKRRHFLRCHQSLHGDLNGDVDIYDINPVPYGSLFEYPYKQKQKDVVRIMVQNQLEVILATHEHQYDLISQGVDSAVYFNPYFRLMRNSQLEMAEQQGR